MYMYVTSTAVCVCVLADCAAAPLGLEDERISDCQLTSSQSASDASTALDARPGAAGACVIE